MSDNKGFPVGTAILFVIFGLFMAGVVWYYMPHEGEIIIQTGASFGPYLYKGKIQGGLGPDTIIIEYNGSEYYFSSYDTVSLDPEHQYRLRFPDGRGIIIKKISGEGS